MKKVMFTLLILFTCTLTFAQSKFEAKDTTSKLPAGVYISNGKVVLKNGYTFKTSKNGKVAMVMAPGGNGISGGFSCYCSEGKAGVCYAAATGSALACLGECGCKMSVTVDGVYNNIPINPETEPSPVTGWKILVIPVKKN